MMMMTTTTMTMTKMMMTMTMTMTTTTTTTTTMMMMMMMMMISCIAFVICVCEQPFVRFFIWLYSFFFFKFATYLQFKFQPSREYSWALWTLITVPSFFQGAFLVTCPIKEMVSRATDGQQAQVFIWLRACSISSVPE